MNCSQLCLFCPYPQKLKVNYSKIHGVCEQLHSNPSAIVKCTFCGTIVPIIYFEEINSTAIQSMTHEVNNPSLPLENKLALQQIPFISPSNLNRQELSNLLKFVSIIPHTPTLPHTSPHISLPSAPIDSDYPIKLDPQPQASICIKDSPKFNEKKGILKKFLVFVVVVSILSVIAVPKGIYYFIKRKIFS